MKFLMIVAASVASTVLVLPTVSQAQGLGSLNRSETAARSAAAQLHA
jgi:hypothetical protein